MIQIPIVLYVVYTVYFRHKFLTVNNFNVKLELPSLLELTENEVVLTNAVSITRERKFFLTNKRFIFFSESLLRGKHFTKYVNIKTIKNTMISFKNPYGFLIVGGFSFIFSIVNLLKNSSSTFKSNDNSGMSFIILILLHSLIVLLWYYLKGYYLILDNNRVTGLFCRSNEGLESILKNFDLLTYSDGKNVQVSTFNNVESSDVKFIANENESKDVICGKCQSVISLDDEEISKGFFLCPICSEKNELEN